MTDPKYTVIINFILSVDMYVLLVKQSLLGILERGLDWRVSGETPKVSVVSLFLLRGCWAFGKTDMVDLLKAAKSIGVVQETQIERCTCCKHEEGDHHSG